MVNMYDRLRKAGKAIREFDADYANKVAQLYAGESGHPKGAAALGSMLGGSPIGERYPSGATTRGEKLLVGAADLGIDATNFAARYALPVGGVTLAGKALYDLAMQFGQGEQTSGTLMP